MRPEGYLTTDRQITPEEAELLAKRWTAAMRSGTVPVMYGIEYHPFEKEHHELQAVRDFSWVPVLALQVVTIFLLVIVVVTR